MGLGMPAEGAAVVRVHAGVAVHPEDADVCRHLLGARQVQCEILTLLCPDLSPTTIEVLLPKRMSFFESHQTRGRSRRSQLPVEDVIFDGTGYEVESAMARRSALDFAPDEPGFIDTLWTA